MNFHICFYKCESIFCLQAYTFEGLRKQHLNKIGQNTQIRQSSDCDKITILNGNLKEDVLL